MSEPDSINVPALTSVFLGVSARNYAEADDAYLRVRDALSDSGTEAQRQHLATLLQRRTDAYSDLVAWIMQTETERLALMGGEAATS